VSQDENDFRRDRSPIRLLVVEATLGDLLRIRETLHDSNSGGFTITPVLHIEQALAMLGEDPQQVLLLYLYSSKTDSLDVLRRATSAAAAVPIVVMSDDDERMARRALRMGAQDYLTKNQASPRHLIRALHHAVERHQLLAELQVARRRAHFAATHDSLTRLPNRLFLLDQLRRALPLAERQGRQLALLFLDLDRFKNINDTLGHGRGDEVLREVAKRLVAETRRSDVIARLGGDEFVVMIQDANRDHSAAMVASKIIELLGRPYLLAGREYWISASVGIAVYPRDGTEPDTLLRNADAALYQAKNGGGNGYQFYSESMNVAARRRMDLEHRLRRAMKNQELGVVYQPKIELATRRVTGAEALLRWRDSELGIVPPDEFIPVAEETGMIVPIGEWVLRTACAQHRSWSQAGFPSLKMMVNISPYQISKQEQSENFTQVLWDTDMDPENLVLEVTESALMRDEHLAVAILADFRRAGIGISLDDFGTGFSSLSNLKRFPIDSVKIDRSFVRDIAFDSDDAAIVASIISIAEQLRLTVIAEGVENQAQLDFLSERGCDEVQGYLFSPPLSGDDFLAMLQDGLGPRSQRTPDVPGRRDRRETDDPLHDGHSA